MSDEKHQERAETQELIELPVSLENLDAKMNHVITHLYYTEQLCNRAAEASETARSAAEAARLAAMRMADTTLKAVQSREPLSRTERFGTVFAGSVVGGAVASIALSLLGIMGAGAAITSCMHP
jgi:F0F1-type ATP synthase beta subunit